MASNQSETTVEIPLSWEDYEKLIYSEAADLQKKIAYNSIRHRISMRLLACIDSSMRPPSWPGTIRIADAIMRDLSYPGQVPIP